MLVRRLATPFVLGLVLAQLGACTREPEVAAGAEPRTRSTGEVEAAVASETGAVEPGPPADPEPDDPRASALTIARATGPASVTGTGSKSLGHNLDKISHLFALAATAKRPEWGAPGLDGAEAKAARDDDLDSAWRCEFGGAQTCVLGLALPEPAQVEALRVYVAAGPSFRDYVAHPRVAKLRVHTAAGWVDAELPDGANHAYVRFAEPIATQQLAIEVLEVHAGKTDAIVHLAEVEIYGTDGVPRQPIDLDPDYAWLSWDTTAWAATGSSHTIRQVSVHLAQPGADGAAPTSKRLYRASGVFGRSDDDYVLFERLHGTDCADGETRGSYVLFDKRNRMYYPLGDLGGAAAEVYRHAQGRGFAVGWIADGVFTVEGVVEEAGELTRKRPPKQAPDELAGGRALLREWGFDPTPLARAQPRTGSIAGCHEADTDELATLLRAAKLDPTRREVPTAWLVCAVGPDTLYAAAPCGQPARVYQLTDGAVIGSHVVEQANSRGLRLRRVGDRVLVELSAGGGDSSSLVWAEPGQLVELGQPRAGAGLFVRPPAACNECDDGWPRPRFDASNPSAVEAGETGEPELPSLDDDL